MGTIKKTAAALVAVLLATAILALTMAPTADAKRPVELDFTTAAPAPAPDGPGWQCPFGSIEDGNGLCRQPVADAEACPKATLGVPGACYIFVDKVLTRTGLACPFGSVEDDKGECRVPIAHITVCPKATYGVPGACYIFVDKVLTKIAFA